MALTIEVLENDDAVAGAAAGAVVGNELSRKPRR